MSNQFEFGFDGTEGRKRRDEGMEKVRSNTPQGWQGNFEATVLALASRGGEFTAEDIRFECGDPPNHHNAFSAAFNSVIRRGWIVWTGRTTPALRPGSHARGGGLRIYRGA